MALEGFYRLNLLVVYVGIIVLIVGAGEVGNWIGLRAHRARVGREDVGTFAAAALGLLALLIAFSFSMALQRYEARRDLVLEEANAIGSTGNFALMLPAPAQKTILGLLRQYAALRLTLGMPPGSGKLERDIAGSLVLQGKLWQQAVALTAAAPQSRPVYRFVGSLNEMNNIHERRVTALRNHVPVVVVLMLIATAMVAMGFTGYGTGVAGARRRWANLLMSVTVASLIVLVIDLDRPYTGLILVPVRALADAVQGLGP